MSNLTYCEISGDLHWTKPKGRRNLKKPVGTLHPSGYLIFSVGLDSKLYSLRVHRVIFFLKEGRWPSKFIDHKNGNRADNRWCNLREANDSQNSRNSSMPSNNKSGYKGVSWQKDKKKWVVRFHTESSYKFLGYFACPTVAAMQYDRFARLHYKEFARLNFP